MEALSPLMKALNGEEIELGRGQFVRKVEYSNIYITDGVIALIALPDPRRTDQALFAVIDAEDVPKVMFTRWSASWQGNAFYVIGTENGKRVRLHRVLMDCPNGSVIDHVNRDPLWNRKSNLRIATRQQNSYNRQTKRKLKGCFEHYGKWKAIIGVNGKRIVLGRFTTPEEAARAYDEAALQFHGQFASLNFPRG